MELELSQTRARLSAVSLSRECPATKALPWLVGALLLISAPGAGALQQEDQEAAREEANEHVRTLAELDASMALLQELVGQEGEAIVSRRLLGYAAQRRDVIWDLTDLAPQLGDDPASLQLVAFSDSLLVVELDRINLEARSTGAAMTNLRSTRADASPTDLLEIEHRLGARIAEIAQSVTDFVEALERMDARGMEPPSIAAGLDRLLMGAAEIALAEMDHATEDAALLRDVIASAGEAASTDTQLRVQAADLRFANATEELDAVLDALDRREIETSSYREELVIRSRDFSPDNLDLQVVGQLIRRGAGRAGEWVRTNAGSTAFRILAFVGILFVFRLLAGLVRKLAARGVATSGLDLSKLLQETVVGWAGRVVMILGVLIALSQVGVNLAPVLAGLGVVGFIVGFALQDTLANFAAGMMILVYRPFDVDDLVEAGGQFGTVATMSLVSTTIRSLDNERLVVPNNAIWGGVIRNLTAERIRRVDLVFGIGYSDDIPKTEKVLARLVSEHPMVLEKPEPNIKVHTLGESSVDFIVRPWCKTPDYWDVYWDLTRSVKLAFDEEGISIPFPQRDVHVNQVLPD